MHIIYTRGNGLKNFPTERGGFKGETQKRNQSRGSSWGETGGGGEDGRQDGEGRVGDRRRRGGWETVGVNIGAIKYRANTYSSVGDLYNFVMRQDPCLTDYF
jgi:hypothetical protein